ncbi:hypothetical protein BEN78_08550 [Xanthomonas citri pv. mangiferaeindicae]|nr:hypothetical protein BEN78_08550 [Xanthomonas citri pv. mangiferaeindicae]
MTVLPNAEDAALAQRLKIGAATVDFATREIHMPGARRAVRLTPKAAAVLRTLTRVPGAVHSRADLLAEVWPDTLPTDDVLTQAVTQLRKAFGSGDTGAFEGRRYIETIAKTGYRLTVPVSIPDRALDAGDACESEHASSAAGVDATKVPATTSGSPTPASGSASVSDHRPSRWRLVILAAFAGACTVVMALLALRGMDSGAARSQEVSGVIPAKPYRLVTSFPGFELSPSLSPNGEMVAYAADSLPDGRALPSPSILVQPTFGVTPRVLSHPRVGEHDDLPAWSPDGRHIAFARWNAVGKCRILLVSATGSGDEREVARCDDSELLSFDWLPDGSGLLFGTMTGHQDGHAIRVLDLATGDWRPIRYPVAAGDIDYSPKISPDGRWIAFVRNPQLGDLWRIPVDGGGAEQLTRLGAELRGLSWSRDGQALIYGRRIGSETRLHRLNLQTGSISDLQIEDAQMPTSARDADMVAFVHRKPQFGIHRVNGRTGHREHMFASSGRDTQPVASPDGRQLVFTSDRAGSSELWWVDLERPDSLRPISGVRPDTGQPPVWSADGRRLLVSALDVQGNSEIVEVVPAFDEVTVLPVPALHPRQAAYGADNGLLVLDEGTDGRTTLVAYDANWRVLGRLEGVSHVRFDPRRERVLYTRLDGSGIWRASPDLTQSQRLSSEIPSRWRYRSWTLTSDGLLSYLDSDSHCRSRMTRFVIDDDQLMRRDQHCLDAASRSAVNGFSSQHQDWLVSIAVEDGTDIGVMTMPPAESESRSLVAKLLIALRWRAS